MGIKKNPGQKKLSLSNIDEQIRVKTGLTWSIYGMKQSDSINRGLMLRGYEGNTINRKTQKAYPLSELTNKQVLSLIELNRLPRPVQYNNDRSQGGDISDIDYLIWLFNKYPNDLQKIFDAFPGTKQLFYEYNQKTA